MAPQVWGAGVLALMREAGDARSCSSASGICLLGPSSCSALELTAVVLRAPKRVYFSCCV